MMTDKKQNKMSPYCYCGHTSDTLPLHEDIAFVDNDSMLVCTSCGFVFEDRMVEGAFDAYQLAYQLALARQK